MTRISAIVFIATVVLAVGPTAALAQGKASASRGTNGAGTAQSSGGAAKRGQTGALGTGNAKAPDTPSGDAVINQENALLERKLKSICRGC